MCTGAYTIRIYRPHSFPSLQVLNYGRVGRPGNPKSGTPAPPGYRLTITLGIRYWLGVYPLSIP